MTVKITNLPSSGVSVADGLRQLANGSTMRGALRSMIQRHAADLIDELQAEKTKLTYALIHVRNASHADDGGEQVRQLVDKAIGPKWNDLPCDDDKKGPVK